MSPQTSSAPLMSRIEMVMHLQSVDLFRSCAATEAVRLAQIAQLVELAEDEVVYRPGEPATTLYTVVQGLVTLEGEGQQHRSVGQRQAFGVPEVLSGRQHGTLARADQHTLVLAISGDDFFDLLSNNINIVKALFREVLAGATSAESADGHHFTEQLADLPMEGFGHEAPLSSSGLRETSEGGSK